MASSRPWPFYDEDDRPSGSVRPLSQADLQAILAHLTDDEPEQHGRASQAGDQGGGQDGELGRVHPDAGG